jgi:hypothetical protein
MKQLIIRYKVKPEQAEHNAELVRAVYAELEHARPEGFHYGTFRLDDGLTFIHLVSHDEDDGVDPLPELDAFRRFRDGVRERCDEAPVATEVQEIGSFRLFSR